MRPHYLLLVLSVLLLPLCTVAVDRRGLFVGGWTPIKDPNDPHVVDIALYAVTEYNKESNATLKFESVIKGETQVLDGINYRLDVTVIDGSETKDYEAVVYEKPSGLNLTSFKPLSILPGGWKPIENPKDPHVVEIAQFAVSEYDNESNATLKFERVIQGETQVVDGINYRLDVAVAMAVIDESDTKDYEAVVFESPSGSYKNLTSFTPLSILPGGWTPIENLKYPHVVEIAQYAVSEFDKESNATLKLETVIKGETQVVDGINYRLDVAVIAGSETEDYEAVVYEIPWEGYMNLTSFTPLY